VYDSHATIAAHVVLVSDVDHLVKAFNNQVKKCCPKNKLPKIKSITGGLAVLSKSTTSVLINHLAAYESSDEEETDDTDSSDEEPAALKKATKKDKPKELTKAIAKKKTVLTKKTERIDLTGTESNANEPESDEDEKASAKGTEDEEDSEEEEVDEEDEEDADDEEDDDDDEEEEEEVEEEEEEEADKVTVSKKKQKIKSHSKERLKKGAKIIKQLFKEDPTKVHVILVLAVIKAQNPSTFGMLVHKLNLNLT